MDRVITKQELNERFPDYMVAFLKRPGLPNVSISELILQRYAKRLSWAYLRKDRLKTRHHRIERNVKIVGVNRVDGVFKLDVIREAQESKKMKANERRKEK